MSGRSGRSVCRESPSRAPDLSELGTAVVFEALARSDLRRVVQLAAAARLAFSAARRSFISFR
jgi:hypothetical protein